MNIPSPINVLVAGLAGVITAIVAWRALKAAGKIDNPLLAACVGGLAGIGLASDRGERISALVIPYQALAITLILLFLLVPFLTGKRIGRGKARPRMTGRKRLHVPEDPWEREIRLRGRLANSFKITRR